MRFKVKAFASRKIDLSLNSLPKDKTLPYRFVYFYQPIEYAASKKATQHKKNFRNYKKLNKKIIEYNVS